MRIFRKTIESMCFSLGSWKLYLQKNKTLPNCLSEQSRAGRIPGSPEWCFFSSLEKFSCCYQWFRVVRPGCTQMFRSDRILEFLSWGNAWAFSAGSSFSLAVSPYCFFCWSLLSLLLVIQNAAAKQNHQGCPRPLFLSLSHWNSSCLLLANGPTSDRGLFSCLKKGKEEPNGCFDESGTVWQFLASSLPKALQSYSDYCCLLEGSQVLPPQNFCENSGLMTFSTKSNF